MSEPFEFAGKPVPAGTRALVEVPISPKAIGGPVAMPVHVLNGAQPGPSVFISAAVHGDELNGVEIIRRMLRTIDPQTLAGRLLCVPIVNAFGFMGRSRYLPDRRDLNRSFPGSENGSLAAQIAHVFMTEIVARCEVGIDLHTASASRTNLPQLRTNLASARAQLLAHAFAAPVVLNSPERPGSLRQAAGQRGCDVIVYEAGEALRFDNHSIRIGERGIARVLAALGMISSPDVAGATVDLPETTLVARSAKWIRAPEGGILRGHRTLGDRVTSGDVLGIVSSPYDDASDTPITATTNGIVIGRTNLPVVNLGDALFHIARVEADDGIADAISRLGDEIDSDPIFDEDEII